MYLDKRSAVTAVVVDSQQPVGEPPEDEVIHHQIESNPGKPSVVRSHPECSAGEVVFRRCIAERLFGGDFRFGVEVYRILLGLPINVRTRCSIVADAGWGNHCVLDIELAGGGRDIFPLDSWRTLLPPVSTVFSVM